MVQDHRRLSVRELFASVIQWLARAVSTPAKVAPLSGRPRRRARLLVRNPPRFGHLLEHPPLPRKVR